MTIDVHTLDEPSAAALARAFAKPGWNKPRDQYERYLAQQAAGEVVCLVAHRDGDLAGYLKVVWDPTYPPLRERRVPEIQDLNVLEPHRRRRVASTLLDRAEELIAQRCDTAAIGVGLHPGYNAAQRLYVLRGYVPDGRGVTYADRPVRERETVRFDDDLVLHFEKVLR